MSENETTTQAPEKAPLTLSDAAIAGCGAIYARAAQGRTLQTLPQILQQVFLPQIGVVGQAGFRVFFGTTTTVSLCSAMDAGMSLASTGMDDETTRLVACFGDGMRAALAGTAFEEADMSCVDERLDEYVRLSAGLLADGWKGILEAIRDAGGNVPDWLFGAAADIPHRIISGGRPLEQAFETGYRAGEAIKANDAPTAMLLIYGGASAQEDAPSVSTNPLTSILLGGSPPLATAPTAAFDPRTTDPVGSAPCEWVVEMEDDRHVTVLAQTPEGARIAAEAMIGVGSRYCFRADRRPGSGDTVGSVANVPVANARIQHQRREAASATAESVTAYAASAGIDLDNIDLTPDLVQFLVDRYACEADRVRLTSLLPSAQELAQLGIYPSDAGIFAGQPVAAEGNGSDPA